MASALRNGLPTETTNVAAKIFIVLSSCFRLLLFYILLYNIRRGLSIAARKLCPYSLPVYTMFPLFIIPQDVRRLTKKTDYVILFTGTAFLSVFFMNNYLIETPTTL